jgi:hypothetical protein
LPLEVAEPLKLASEPVVTELKRAPVMAIQPTGEEIELAQVVAPLPVNARVAAVPALTLPSTASTLPLIAAFGLVTLTGSVVVRAVATRM